MYGAFLGCHYSYVGVEEKLLQTSLSDQCWTAADFSLRFPLYLSTSLSCSPEQPFKDCVSTQPGLLASLLCFVQGKAPTEDERGE